MGKIIAVPHKWSLAIAFAVAAIFISQLLPISAFAQTPPLTAAQQAQLQEEARKSFLVTLFFSADVAKKLNALTEGGTTEITALVRQTNTPLPMLAELLKGILYLYLPEGVRFDTASTPALRMQLTLAQRIFPPKLLPFDDKFDNSIGISKIPPAAFAVDSAKATFGSSVQEAAVKALAQAGAAPAAPATPTAKPGAVAPSTPSASKVVFSSDAVAAAVKAAEQKKATVVPINGVRYVLAYNSTTGQFCGYPQGSPTKRACAKMGPGNIVTLPTPATPAVPAAARPSVAPPAAPTAPRTPTTPTTPPPSALFDFGDAPSPGFPTLLRDRAPRHRLSNRVWLGDFIDGEPDGSPVDRDDQITSGGVDDEDGMLNSNPFVLLVRTGPQVNSTVYINAWEDWNANNRWDINANGAPGDEWIVRNQRVSVRPNSVQNVFLLQPRNGPDGRPLPAAWSDPAFWVRFMVTEASIPNGNPAVNRLYPSGEVEDYIGVLPPIPSTPPPPTPPTGGTPTNGGDQQQNQQQAPHQEPGAPAGGDVPATGGGLRSSAAPQNSFFGLLYKIFGR